ncbi:MAG: hypothetical protein KJ606_08690 [Chloroflexi bacterium]|nr:hypothetical protein [Chloroflexota bacterium]
MLLSLLLPLTATNSYPILGALGRPANAWSLAQASCYPACANLPSSL